MEAHQSPVATEAIQRIGQLYAIEKEIRGRSPDERRRIRSARARPLLDAMHLWLKTSLSSLSRKSDTAASPPPSTDPTASPCSSVATARPSPSC